MVTEERPDEQDDATSVTSEGPQGLVPVDVGEPKPPQGLEDAEAQQLKSRAAELVTQLEEASGSGELEVIDNITHVGTQAQRAAGGQLDLLRTRVGDMATQEGTSGSLAQGLADLRLELNKINPHELERPGMLRGIIGILPFVQKFNPVLRTLERIAVRYEPVSKQVQIIETRLRDGRMMLSRDNVELRKLYEQVEEQQLPIQRNAYLGELILQRLNERQSNVGDPMKSDRWLNAMHDVSMRVQDLRTMETVHVQFFVSIDMTRQNNNRLGQSVERTMALATNVVTVGLATQTALARQRRVLEATQRTREYLGELITANAGAIRQHTEEIGDLLNNPVVAIDKITQAHNELMEAMTAADRLKQEGIDSARENIAKLGQMSAELTQRASGLRDQVEAEPRSLEA